MSDREQTRLEYYEEKVYQAEELLKKLEKQKKKRPNSDDRKTDSDGEDLL